MPRLGNLLKDISTTISPVDEGEYRAVVTVVETLSNKSKLPMLTFTFKIQGSDFDGREVLEYCVMETKTGEVNDAGLRSIKKVCEPVFGERVDEDDFDTDEINSVEVNIYVVNEQYIDKSGLEQTASRLGRVIGAA